MQMTGAVLAGLMGAANPAALQAADALPERLLKIELRCADGAPAAAAAPRPGDRVVGTATPASGVTVGTRPLPAAGPAPMEVVVANGQPALLRWTDPQAAWDLVFDAAFITAPAGRTPRASTDAPLLALRPVRRVQALQLLPRWPGGGKPVRVDVLRVEGANGAAVGAAIDAPLARWTPLARAQRPEASAADAACTLQLRVQPLVP